MLCVIKAIMHKEHCTGQCPKIHKYINKNNTERVSTVSGKRQDYLDNRPDKKKKR